MLLNVANKCTSGSFQYAVNAYHKCKKRYDCQGDLNYPNLQKYLFRAMEDVKLSVEEIICTKIIFCMLINSNLYSYFKNYIRHSVKRPDGFQVVASVLIMSLKRRHL